MTHGVFISFMFFFKFLDRLVYKRSHSFFFIYMVGFLENKYAFFLVNVQKSENIYIMANKSINKENVFITKIR